MNRKDFLNILAKVSTIPLLPAAIACNQRTDIGDDIDAEELIEMGIRDETECIFIFHGGCLGCTMQLKEGLGYCTGCQYFEADWSLPDLNDSHARMEEKMNAIRDMAREMANKNK